MYNPDSRITNYYSRIPGQEKLNSSNFQNKTNKQQKKCPLTELDIFPCKEHDN